MQTMNGKEVLRAIADGADPSEFQWFDGDKVLNVYDWNINSFTRPNGQFRRKPRTRVVNGFTVPAPIQEMPKNGDRLFYIHLFYSDWCFEACFSRSDEIYYSRGLLFSTKEAAIANAKAMVGIDPNT